MTRIKATLLACCMLITVVVSNTTQYASALTTNYGGFPQCTNSDTRFDQWNWPSYIQNGTSTGGTGALPTFNASTSSYILLKDSTLNSTYASGASWPTSGYPAESTNFYRLAIMHGSGQLTMTVDSGSGIGYVTYSGQVDWVNITSEPISDPTYRHYWNGYSSNGLIVTYSTAGVNGDFPLSSTLTCYTTHNVVFSSAWTALYNTMNSNLAVGSGSGGVQCSLVDLLCIMGKIGNSIDSAFQATGMAIVQSLSYMFVPDATNLANIWTDFSTFMQNKLGFLLYPFTFFGNLFTAFTTYTGSCSTSSCVVVTGTFKGGAFSLDLADFSRAFPTLWTVVDGAIIGITLVGLIMGIRHKYLSVVRQ